MDRIRRYLDPHLKHLAPRLEATEHGRLRPGKDAAFVMGKNADQLTGSQRPKSETACESEQVEPSPHPNNPRQAPVIIRRRSLSMDTGAT